MSPIATSLLLLLLIALGVECAIPEHEVVSLPGWFGKLPSRQYSGYIPLGNSTTGKQLHYWFVESEGTNQANDPVVLWLNGGPGCSSLDGYFNEQGPLHFNRSGYSTGLPNLIYNPWTWTRIANMIFLEAPAGVGFSYSDNPKDYYTNDSVTAQDNYHFLVNWFTAYPEYKKNDFYVTGESYAGIYVPTLVDTIMNMNPQQTPDKQINLKGFAVGNGCVGNEVGNCGGTDSMRIHVEFYHGHGLFPDALYTKIQQACNFSGDIDEVCRNLMQEMSDDIGKVNIYDIYDVCNMNLSSSKPSRATNPLKTMLESNRHRGAQNPSRLYGPFDCIDDHVEKSYFDNDEVRQAIHVKSVSEIGGWSICTHKVHYRATTASLLPIYPSLIKRYRTMIYNGDVDGCVPYIGDEEWTSSLGYPVLKPWRPWMVDSQVAGYITEYDQNGFKFVTVKGSGHMVPQYQPKNAFYMFQNYLIDSPF